MHRNDFEDNLIKLAVVADFACNRGEEALALVSFNVFAFTLSSSWSWGLLLG